MNDISKNIWTDFNNKLKGFIVNKVKDKGIADDNLQEVFLKILNNRVKISEAKNIQHYIYAIARHTTMDYFRNLPDHFAVRIYSL